MQMNSIFRVKWNRNLRRYDVVSELGSRNSKVTGGMDKIRIGSPAIRLSTLAALIATSLLQFAQAQDFTVVATSPTNITTQVMQNGSNSLTGDFSAVQRGNPGYQWMTLGEARAQGYISTDSEKWVDYNIIRRGSQTKPINIKDEKTGANKTMLVYDNSDFEQQPASEFGVSVSIPAGVNGQYVDKNFYEIGAGTTLDVNVGKTDSTWVTDASNYFSAILKSSVSTQYLSSVFHVISDASSSAALNYQSKTVVNLGNSYNNINSAKNPLANMSVDTFTGEFDSQYLGHWTVNNLEDFKKYNSALISALEKGEIHLTNDQYQEELMKAWDDTNHPILANLNIADDDAVQAFVTAAAVSYIRADGAGSTVTIGDNANIQMMGSTATLVSLENGARLVNNGVLGTAGNPLQVSYIVNARDTSVVENNGVIDAGTNPEMTARFPGTQMTGVAYGRQTAIKADGSATIKNNATGVINLASRDNFQGNTGLILSGKANFTNDGNLNIAASQESASIFTTQSNIGVEAMNSNRVTNNGQIYIGREAQRSVSEDTADLAIGQHSIGVHVYGSAVFDATQDSLITIGSLVENATAIDIGGTATLNQAGTININGNVASDSAARNVGILVQKDATRADRVVNSGTINLNGINAIGIDIEGGGQATHTGTININSGFDSASGYPNYGVVAEATGALAIISGDINLKGDRAVGVYAQNGGIINVINQGAVNFITGQNQTGYLIYGAGSAVNNTATGSQVVSTQGSTLYRIDKGATFTGDESGTSTLSATGKDSTIIRVTGQTSKGEQSTLTTGGLALEVHAEGATGVRVEGGAKGTIDADTDITISGTGATAGIVDGRYFDYKDAKEDANLKGDSVLTSYATLSADNTASDALGYKVLSGGTLEHKGSIDFTGAADSTGVLVNGGTLDNSNTIAVNGVAVDIEGSDSAVTNTGTVTATDGTAAYRVGSGASLTLNGAGTTNAKGTANGILLDTGAVGLSVEGATIQMDADGTGNGIENTAEITGIQLTDTIINVGKGAGIRTASTLASENSGAIAVNGSGTGILFENKDGTTTDGAFDLSASQNLVIDVNSAQGKGLVTNTRGAVMSGVSVNINNEQGGAALEIGGTTSRVEQSGKLSSSSLEKAVVDLQSSGLDSMLNSGSILARSADQVAVQASSDSSGIAFTNAQGGVIRGRVNLEGGENRVNLEHGSQATDVFTLGGNDSYRLKNIDDTDSALFTSLNAGTGSDLLQLDGSQYALNADGVLNGFENISLINQSRFTLNKVSLALGDNQDDAAGTGYSIEAGSTLGIVADKNVDFASHLAGAGLVQVNLGSSDNAFAFTANNAGDGFTGTVDLADSRFLLYGDNTSALSKATLKLSDGNITTVAKGTQTIGGLTFNGGTARFDTDTLGKGVSESYVETAGLLDISGRGQVQVMLNPVLNAPTLPDNTLNLMQQDDAQIGLKLAGTTGSMAGSGGNLTLIDQNGNVISDAVTASVEQNGMAVANATYDYRLTGGDNSDGLWVNYGLKSLALLTKGENALTLSAAGLQGAGADLSAQVTGDGDLAVDSGAGNTLSLSNLDNDYTGVTDVRSGNLLMVNDNVLGQTAELRQAADTAVDMGGHSQRVGLLNTQAGAKTMLNGGTLTVANGGEVNGALSGAGNLVLSGGTLAINGANSELSAATRIDAGAEAALNHASGLGSGGIQADGTLRLKQAAGDLVNALSGAGLVAAEQGSNVTLRGDNSLFAGRFDISADSQLTATSQTSLGTGAVADEGILTLDVAESWQIANAISGSGDVHKAGAGQVVLQQAAAQYTGQTDVATGTLTLGSAGSDVTLASSAVSIASGAVFGGYGGTAGDVSNQGTLVVGELTSPLTRALATSGSATTFTVGGNLTNASNIVIGQSGSGTPGNVLHVSGDYIGNGGTIAFNTALGGDDSATDRMIIDGSTSGTSAVSVTNAGGSGAQTLNGIELISVGGNSAGEFTQSGRIVAGAYDYQLVRGSGSNASNWYLVSGTNPDPTPTPDPDPQPTPDPEPTPEPWVRPEAGIYTANIAAANTLFVNRLHDRLGETHYVDALTGEERVTSMWLRNVGGHNRFKDSSGQLSTQANRYVMQLGGDVAQWSSDGQNRFHLGVMGGYANQKSNSRNSHSGYHADGSINGYSVGLYGTWLQDNETKTGAYVDTWLQYNWFNNSVSGESIGSESYKSKGLTGSVEAGYTWKLGERDEHTSFYIQPKAQAIWMGVKADDHTEVNGTRVSSEGDGNVQTRLGLRGFIKGHSKLDDGKQRTFEPFVEANWIHNTRDFGATMNGVRVTQAGARNIGELKVGVEGQLNPHVNLWGNVAQQVGDKGYSDTSAMLGVKVNF
jgi:autotransporter family porin